MPKKNRALFLSRVKGMRGRAMTHLRILSSNTASPPLFVFSCPHSCEDWQGRGARSAKVRQVPPEKSGGAAVLTILPSGLPPLPLPPFPSLPKAPLVVPKGAFLPDDFFSGVFPMSVPSLAPVRVCRPNFPRHLTLTCVDLCEKHFFLVLRRPTRRRPQALRGSASGFHSSAKLQNRAVLQVS